MISKQYAGPQIVRVDLGPSGVLAADATTSTTRIVSGPLLIDAYIAPEDIASMNQGAVETNRGYVLFTVTPLNGAAVASQKVTLPVSTRRPTRPITSSPGTTPPAPDGIYIIQAVAVAGYGSRSQGMPWSIALEYRTRRHPAPPNLAALPGDGERDPHLDHGDDGERQEVRGVPLDRRSQLREVGEATTTPRTPTPAVTNGTLYYYKVRTIDTNDLIGLFTTPVTATPNPPQDVVAPVAAGASHGDCGRRAADGAPDVGHLDDVGYADERARRLHHRAPAERRSIWEPLQALYAGNVYDDTTAGWSTTWTYRVLAIDLAGNQSTHVVPAPSPPRSSSSAKIAVTNNSTTQSYVWVQNVGHVQVVRHHRHGVHDAAGLGCVGQEERQQRRPGPTCPAGIYNVYFMKTATGFSPANQLKFQLVDTAAPTAYGDLPMTSPAVRR